MIPNYVKISAFLMVSVLMISCQPAELPTAALWTDGAWVLFDQTRKNVDGSETSGTLKISAVGKETVDGNLYHWIEFREDNEQGVKLTKFLTTERVNYNIKDGFNFWDQIIRIIVQENSGVPEEIPQQHLKRFSPSFVEHTKSKRFGNVKDAFPPKTSELSPINITVGGKNLKCSGTKYERKYSSEVNLGFLNLEDTTESASEYYTHSDIPFGSLVKVVHTSTTSSVNKLKPDQAPKPPTHFVHSLTLKSYGSKGAASEVTGEPVEKQILPFPFLKGGAQG